MCSDFGSISIPQSKEVLVIDKSSIPVLMKLFVSSFILDFG
jgi:hypothetical protein